MVRFDRNSRSITITLLLLIIICSCAHDISRVTWIENGKQIGIIKKYNLENGSRWEYFDMTDKLQRIDIRDNNDELLEGACVIKLYYNIDGKLFEERFYDSHESPTNCEKGYAIKRHSYSTNDKMDNIENISFYNIEGDLENTTSGYAIKKLTYKGTSNFVKEIYFLDEHDQPASINWNNQKGVSHVKYFQLDGAGPVTCAVYYSPKGEIIGRNVINGAVRWERAF